MPTPQICALLCSQLNPIHEIMGFNKIAGWEWHIYEYKSEFCFWDCKSTALCKSSSNMLCILHVQYRDLTLGSSERRKRGSYT